MGVLVASAVGRLRCPEEANLRSPESVLSLHLGFIRAGADVIETNTFGANRRKLAEHYLEDDVRAINEAAVKIARDAREVSGRDVFIAGSIGPLAGSVKDRRATFVRLTRKGMRLFETMAEAHERWVNEILASISDEQAESMIRLLDTLRTEAHTGERSR